MHDRGILFATGSSTGFSFAALVEFLEPGNMGSASGSDRVNRLDGPGLVHHAPHGNGPGAKSNASTSFARRLATRTWPTRWPQSGNTRSKIQRRRDEP